MRRAVAVLALLAVACSQSAPRKASTPPTPTPPTAGSSTPTPSPQSPPTSPQPPRAHLALRSETVVTGLEAPWAMAFAADGAIWITERPGRVRVVRNGQLLPDPALTLPVATSSGGESGLLGLALKAPDAFLYYTYRGGGGLTNRVSRFAISGDQLTGEQVVLDGIPGGQCCHFGGRLKIGPDGFLYIAVGEAQVPSRAADPNGLNGKLLRLKLDGSGPEVIAYGLRNPEGIAWDPAGRLFVSDNGPTGEFGFCCHDEINLIQPGGYYGWPALAGNSPTGAAGAANPIPPLFESGSDTWAPSGIAFYSPAKDEEPALVVAMLRGQGIRRFTAPHQEVVLSGAGRIRDVAAGPDGCLYALTSNRDGRGSPQAGDDHLLKLCPA